mmetsp:Transcript_23014/g.65216  ORF Transcript_23014/g.65216 Transcript_23014/m.65216 type:complete len:221 (+) Transcript_23014:49-711(+)
MLFISLYVCMCVYSLLFHHGASIPVHPLIGQIKLVKQSRHTHQSIDLQLLFVVVCLFVVIVRSIHGDTVGRCTRERLELLLLSTSPSLSVILEVESKTARFHTGALPPCRSILRRLRSFLRKRSARSRRSISTGSYFITKSSRLFMPLARAASSGYFSSSWHSHFHAILLRPVRVFIHTASKLRGEQKFCVMATLWWRFSTACHQPLGMNTVSPGFCVNS